MQCRERLEKYDRERLEGNKHLQNMTAASSKDKQK